MQTEMQWFNEPPTWDERSGWLEVTTSPKSDFWRKTHYGFIRDSGHFYYQEIHGDFVAEVKVNGRYEALYDQAGLMLRVDEENWIKTGIEYFDELQHASAVVTRDFSDWSVAPLADNPPSLWLRIVRTGEAVEIFYSLDSEEYLLLRVAYLVPAPVTQVGLMCASPEGSGFSVTFEDFKVTPA
jgi:regulation of enolase protein 1 (concanavalin A-like superfamily)